jgi:hypothetical protein
MKKNTATEACVALLTLAEALGQRQFRTAAAGAYARIIESLIGGLFAATRPYLPYTVSSRGALGGGASGPARDTSGGTLARLRAAL